MADLIHAAPDETAVSHLAKECGISESTARAALLLDAVAPGWDENIDLDTLRMMNPFRCILGQQFGKHPYFGDCAGFGEVLDKLDRDVDAGGDVWRGGIYNFSHSESEWATLVTARRAAG